MKSQGYNNVMAVAGLEKQALEISTEGKNWSESPALMGGAGLLGAGGLGLGAGAGTEYLTRKFDMIEPGVADKAVQFRNLGETIDAPADFLAEYTDRATDLVRRPVVRTPKGELRSGQELIESTRGGPLGKLLSTAEVIRPFSPGSRRHYQEFAKGPVPAAREMFRESFDDLPGQMRGEILGRRYQAAKELAGKDLENAPAQMIELMTGDTDPGMSRLLRRLETQMFEQNPETYQQVFDVIQEGGDPSQLQNQLLDPLLTGTADPQRHIDEILEAAGITADAVTEAPDPLRKSVLRRIFSADESQPILQYALSKMDPVYRGNIKEYQSLIDPLAQVDAGRRWIQRAGRAAGLAGLLGAGAGGYLLHKGLQDTTEPSGLRVSW